MVAPTAPSAQQRRAFAAELGRSAAVRTVAQRSQPPVQRRGPGTPGGCKPHSRSGKWSHGVSSIPTGHEAGRGSAGSRGRRDGRAGRARQIRPAHPTWRYAADGVCQGFGGGLARRREPLLVGLHSCVRTYVRAAHPSERARPLIGLAGGERHGSGHEPHLSTCVGSESRVQFGNCARVHATLGRQFQRSVNGTAARGV